MSDRIASSNPPKTPRSTKLVAWLGLLSWWPIASVSFFLLMGKNLPEWSLWLFVPGGMLFAAAPIASIIGTLVGCYRLLRGTTGMRERVILVAGLFACFSFLMFSIWSLGNPGQ